MDVETGGTTTRRSWLYRLAIGDTPNGFEQVVPDRYRLVLKASLRGWLLTFGLTVLAATMLVGPNVRGFHFYGALALVAGMFGAALFAVLQPEHRILEAVSLVMYGVVPMVGVSLWAVGPSFEAIVAVIPLITTMSFILLRRRTALMAAAVSMLSYGAAILLLDGYAKPWAHLVFAAGLLIAAERLFTMLTTELGLVAQREHEANLELQVVRADLANANRMLEAQVDEQVGEIERLGRLRRFLSPQVADTVMSTGGEDLLTTHRRQIAVIFIDLRGFTAFSAVAEPEDVVDLLTEFYGAVGAILKRLEATVGAFAGDGVMAYFNDPVPCDDPAGRAFETATSLRLPMADLGTRWSRRGFNIGYGVGIAYGYATLGTIGFDERTDYTPLGSVVNLASRLCDEAANGEILIDGRAHEALRDHISADEVQLNLKGFAGAVTAYRVRA